MSCSSIHRGPASPRRWCAGLSRPPPGASSTSPATRPPSPPTPPSSPPDIPGLELAGEVLSCGPGASRFSPGDRVMAIVGGGGQAELAVVHERVLMAVPEALEWVQAGAVPEVFTTAHDAVFTQA